MDSSSVTFALNGNTDSIVEEGEWKLMNFKIRSSVITEDVLKDLDKNLNNLHIQPYYKGKLKFQDLTQVNLIYQLLTMSKYNYKESPEIDKVYAMIVPKVWEFKRTDELNLHVLITYYYKGIEGRIRYKVEMRSTSNLLNPSAIDDERMYKTIKAVYNNDKEIRHSYIRLMTANRKLTNLKKK